MEEANPISARRGLWLRSERALGLESVAAIAPVQSPSPTATTALFEAPIADSSALATEFSSPIFPREQKLSLLSAMDQGEVKPCQRCRLCESRKHTVFGEGDPDARIFFIGEGPGENEDLQGRPFVGRAGDLLNKMIAAMGLGREQVFIANIVKCRPPANRVPAPDEVAACTPYLLRQLEIIRPQVIVTLGLPASKYMLDSKLSMGKLRGQWHQWRGIKLMPTFHPAYLLRSYTEENRAMVWSDLQKVMAEVGLTAPSR
ncbi:MAG: uracil-DNA glycosylase [Tepidisphaeraceae bacterium]|jgi:DNA polymerase